MWGEACLEKIVKTKSYSGWDVPWTCRQLQTERQTSSQHDHDLCGCVAIASYSYISLYAYMAIQTTTSIQCHYNYK